MICFLVPELTYKNMLAFIAGLSEVQIMLNGVRLVGSELDGHVELTPSFFLNAERRLFEHCSNYNYIVSIPEPNHYLPRPILRGSSVH
jgi:hypothetical protein